MVTMEKFGEVCGKPVNAYTIQNTAGMAVTILNLGGIVQKMLVPAGDTKLDVCLGYDTVEEYLAGKNYFGALIGRFGNRIANAEFTLNGKHYALAANDGKNQCHGGPAAFDRKIWDVETGDHAVTLRYVSPDGEGGFPGNLQVSVTYRLGEDNGLVIDYFAKPDADTLVNMTNHSYFNLSGVGPVTAHTLQVESDFYTVNNDEVLPTGEIASVAGTAMDFRTPKTLGQDIEADMLRGADGYDNNFCLRGEGLRKVAELRSPELTMEVETTTPGMQIYCSNFRTPKKGKATYEGRCFVCLETQGYPDSIHHENFPTAVVRAGETYRQTTIYRFI